MIVKTAKEEYSFYKYLSLIIPKSFEAKIDDKFRPSDSVIEKNLAEIRKPITINKIKNYTANAGNLTIGTTQACNLRCRYCIYGGDYIYRRKHSTKSMKFDTYIQSINFFFQLINSPLRTNRNGITIGFYGGEPLLNFDNLYKSTKYAKELHSKNTRKFPLTFIVTTNGVLLNMDISKKLIEQGFIIDISLDGPEEDHDKFRVKTNGTGSFADILFNVEKIKDKFPEYYSKNLRFYVTLHPFHDVRKLEEFFLSRGDLFNEKNVSFAWVGLRDLKKNMKKSLSQARLKQSIQIENELDKDKWVYRKLIFTWLGYIFENPTQNLANKIDFTGSCYPAAERIFVDVEGNLHICERINSHFSIGNVYTGFDFKKIKEIIKNWNEEIVKMMCWECPGWWLCGCCLANRATLSRFVLNKEECNRFVEVSVKSCAEFLNILEVDDEIKSYNCYSDINRYLDSL